ncbi:MAG: hypothetical protein Q8L78_06970 [Coxiellaceae bacterium]|nr:hypothetical protein [Coxiellaceae bacterium]
MKKTDLSSLFRQNIIIFLEKYVAEKLPERCPKIDYFAIKERINTWELAWIIEILNGKYPIIGIPWTDSSLIDCVKVRHQIILEKIDAEVIECCNRVEIQALSLVDRTNAIYELLGITWEILSDFNGKDFSGYWIEPVKKTFESIISRIVDSILKSSSLLNNNSISDLGVRTTNVTSAMLFADKDRPSKKCKDKTEAFYLEIEEIVIKNGSGINLGCPKPL